MIRAYYGRQVFGEYENHEYPRGCDVPEGTILYISYNIYGRSEPNWYTVHLTPIPEEEVDKEVRALQMVLGDTRSL